MLRRKELPTTTPAYFGFGGAAVSLLCSLSPYTAAALSYLGARLLHRAYEAVPRVRRREAVSAR